LPQACVTWPHQVRVGANCILQPDIFFNYDHYWTPGPSIVLGNRVFVGRGVEFNIQGRIVVGDDALIASGCVFVDHDHGMRSGGAMNTQPNIIEPISVGAGAWIGTRSVVLKGVSIGAQAVVGAGSVVTKSVPAGEVWCGTPARFVRHANEAAADSLITED
jgi:acetyltransferase-like isoleucine patch superfamily enzyme